MYYDGKCRNGCDLYSLSLWVGFTLWEYGRKLRIGDQKSHKEEILLKHCRHQFVGRLRMDTSEEWSE